MRCSTTEKVPKKNNVMEKTLDVISAYPLNAAGHPKSSADAVDNQE